MSTNPMVVFLMTNAQKIILDSFSITTFKKNSCFPKLINTITNRKKVKKPTCLWISKHMYTDVCVCVCTRAQMYGNHEVFTNHVKNRY